MQLIHVKCDIDGEQDMLVTGCHVTIRHPGKLTIEFFCVDCHQLVVKEISSDLCNQLRQAGVATSVLEVPEEYFELKKGDPICEAEVNEFCAAMERPSFDVPPHMPKPLVR